MCGYVDVRIADVRICGCADVWIADVWVGRCADVEMVRCEVREAWCRNLIMY